MELHWIPSKEMIFSNHLSRNGDTSKIPNEPTCKGLDLKIQDVYLNASEGICTSLNAETDKDEILVALKRQIIKGWPSQRSECSSNLTEYWNYRDELSILDRLVLKRTRTIFPAQCREELLEKLHEGQNKTKSQGFGILAWNQQEHQNPYQNLCYMSGI